MSIKIVYTEVAERIFPVAGRKNLPQFRSYDGYWLDELHQEAIDNKVILATKRKKFWKDGAAWVQEVLIYAPAPPVPKFLLG